MTRRTRPLIALAAIALAGSLAGCNGGSDDSTSPPEQTSGGATSPPPSETGQPSGEPTSTASSSEFTEGPTEDPNGSPASRGKASQIPADELAGLNDEWKWRVSSQRPGPGDSPPSLCTLSSLESIGAASEYRTDYRGSLSASRARATVITAVFPDEQTAALAKTVIRSWHAKCEQRLNKQFGYTRVSVSAIERVTTDVGRAEHWMSVYGPFEDNPDEGTFQAEGFIADGDTMTYIVIASVGQDYNYEIGQRPVELALQIAGSKLEESR